MNDPCAKCSAPLAPNSVICTNCGTHVRSGLDINTVQKVAIAKKAGSVVVRTILGICLACVTSIMGAAVFAFSLVMLENTVIVYLTALGAAAVGGIAGLTFAAFFKERTVVLGMLAVIPAVFGMLAGQVLEANWSTGRFARKIVEDNTDMCKLVYFNRDVKREIKQDVLAIRCETDTIHFELDEATITLHDLDYDAVLDQAAADMNNDSDEVKARIVTAFLERNWSLIDRIKLGLNFLDLIWFGIAITVAWRIARGSWGGAFNEY